ncbi:hypothetical protein evm_014823 [Chilo suppressalis]|nr:hypothetical protein evm_014823 [Chilo suppressalis]
MSGTYHTAGTLRGNTAQDTKLCQEHITQLAHCEELLRSKTEELEAVKNEKEELLKEWQKRVEDVERRLEAESSALATERNRNAILQEQVSSRGHVSPHSVGSDSASVSVSNSNSGWMQISLRNKRIVLLRNEKQHL